MLDDLKSTRNLQIVGRETPRVDAIEKLTGVAVVCKDFRVHSVTVGKDAQGEVMVEVEYGGRLYRGRGVSTDSVEAAAKAFLNAINRIVSVSSSEPEEPNPNV